MQGITIDDRWPKSKKEIKEVLEREPERVKALATSFFGGEYNGRIDRMPTHQRVDFAGPDPHNARKFYGTIAWNASRTKLVVK